MPRLQRFARSLSRHLLVVAVAVVAASCDDPAKSPVHRGATAGWPTVGGDPGGSHASPLTEITPENVHRLEVAWTLRTGPPLFDGRESHKLAYQATPILRERTLHLCTPDNRALAVDAETGRLLWSFAAKPRFESDWAATCRGVASWQDAARNSVTATAAAGDLKTGESSPAGRCDARIFMGTLDARLIALDARTGAPCAEFGEAGVVDLLAGLGETLPGEYYMTSGPTVVGDVVVTGALVADGRRVDPPGGVVRGFDARTGRLAWAFDPVPPGTPPLPRDSEGAPRFHRGTPNVWAVPSVDVARGLVFLPMGNPSPDYFGGRREGFDHYGSSVVALDGRTGEVVWHFQTVHHDLWDYDVSSQPMLIDVPIEGVMRPAVAQLTKMGHLFLLDRETGEPLHPVDERPVAQTDVPGEWTSPTQPFPTFPPPLHPSRLQADDAWGFTPYDRAACRRRIEALRNEGIFTPPSLQGSMLYPGTAGGSNWGGGAYDSNRRLLVLNQNRIAQSLTLLERGESSGWTWATRPRGLAIQAGTPFMTAIDVLVSPWGVPCSPPPWGTLLAVDLEEGEVAWERPFGTTRDMTPLPIGFDIGMPSMGGPIVTATGVVFIGAAMDDYFRAHDVETGEELWRERLPAGAQATPMTYRLDQDGPQFVVIVAGGHATLGTTPGDYLMAWALPR